MLKILSMDGKYKFKPEDTGISLFRDNPELNLVIEAPIFWWLDCEFERFDFIFPKMEQDFCFDEWQKSSPFIANLKTQIEYGNMTDRQLMEILPLSTIVRGRVVMSYQKIVEICENYQCGEYAYQELRNQWPTEREWRDFCETLLDIKGIRDLVEV